MGTRTQPLSTTPKRLRHLLLVALGQQEVGEKIRLAREAIDISQQALAEKIGLASGQSISNYERGKLDVPPKRLRAIAEVTSMPLSYFLDEPDSEPEPDALRLAIREETAEIRDLVARIAVHLGLDDAQSA